MSVPSAVLDHHPVGWFKEQCQYPVNNGTRMRPEEVLVVKPRPYPGSAYCSPDKQSASGTNLPQNRRRATRAIRDAARGLARAMRPSIH